jgi:hypothetical protein
MCHHGRIHDKYYLATSIDTTMLLRTFFTYSGRGATCERSLDASQFATYILWTFWVSSAHKILFQP